MGAWVRKVGLVLLLGASVASAASVRVARDAGPAELACGACRHKMRQCFGLPYGSALSQAETNAYIACSKDTVRFLL